jgi:hypothetical protein
MQFSLQAATRRVSVFFRCARAHVPIYGLTPTGSSGMRDLLLPLSRFWFTRSVFRQRTGPDAVLVAGGGSTRVVLDLVQRGLGP